LKQPARAYSSGVTVLEIIQRSSEFLAKKGVDSPRLQTELLLAHLLQLPRMQLYLNFERVLAEEEVDRFREYIKRRAQREPLQHIIGSTSFCGFEIAVNRDVLVPRPETELLAEHGWLFLNDQAALKRGVTALDFGTGSGCIAIALAEKCPRVEVYALDRSEPALKVAAQNAAVLADRIRFVLGDGFDSLAKDLQFDLVISNPPYIPTAEIDTLEPEVRDYDPRQALDGGADGLDFYRKLAIEVPPLLKPGGKVMLEFGDGQAEKLQETFRSENWIVEAVIEDYTRRPRILVASRE
jgi:release factor glutamine methyltransferase